MSPHDAVAGWGYFGVDINPAIIRACNRRFPDREACFGDVYVVDTPGLKHDMTLFIPA